MMRLNIFIFFLSALLYAVNALNADGVTLLSLQRHWTFVPHPINSSWNVSDSTPCSWLGVQCDKDHNAIFLNISGYSISGLVGPEIAHLSHLQTLDLTFNYFSGKIPPVLGNCSLLENLNLSDNMFSGQIPDSLRNLQKLVYFNVMYNMLTDPIDKFLFQLEHLQYLLLSNNFLTGPIPMNVGNATEILWLYLDSNQFSGRIPPSIGNCSKLVQLFLDNNQLHGVIPESINNLQSVVFLGFSNNTLEGTIPLLGSGRCKSLYYLDLSLNKFSGGIPSSLGNCSGLTKLYAVNANLIGNIPASLGLLKGLSVLSLPINQLSGRIPSEIGNCKSLKELFLHGNHLSGEIPVSIWKIPSLVQVTVSNNRLSGELPLELTQLKQLKNISLFNNQFSGVIPQTLGVNSSLEVLYFSYNYFTGNIPPNLCFGQQLQAFVMIFNQLQGGIPLDLGRCTSLTRLRLTGNNLTEPLPNFTNSCNLTFMDISENSISGPIPSNLGNCTNLTDVNLSHNNFSGHIPFQLGSLVNLQRLNLSHNKLEGPLPHELSNCLKMEEFAAGFNSLNGSFPSSLRTWTGLTTLNLRENHFTGGIPTFLSEFKRILNLHLGGNSFGGQIPRSIGEMQNLLYELNLSANELTGEIPPEIGKLKMLQSLDISLNNLTGNIEVLEDLSSLVALNISYNSFYGPLPDTLVNLLHSSPSSFLGNPSLCLRCFPSYRLNCSKSNSLKPCYENNFTHRKGLSKIKVVMIALGSTLLVTFLLLGLVYVLHYKQDVKIFAEPRSSSFLRKLMKATENLHDRHIIGRGSHGIIYKVEFSPDKVFVVKKIPYADNKGQIISMSTEIETTVKIRHRNLVRIKNFWLRKDCGLILYKYMENGSLHDVLHEKYPSPSLEWSVRFKIAVGIAHGLEYLHHDCDPVIVHRDIKPKNILLDSDMEPHIADFGIATLLDHSSSLQSFTVSETVGYIAPENAYSTVMSRKSDVYSYGVVLLELISRKKVLDDPSFVEEIDLVEWVKSVWEKTRDINYIVDSSLKEEVLASKLREKVEQVLLVALRCTEKHPSERPTMREVVKELIVGCKAK